MYSVLALSALLLQLTVSSIWKCLLVSGVRYITRTSRRLKGFNSECRFLSLIHAVIE